MSKGQQGTVLLAVLLLGFAVAASSTLLLAAARQGAAELRSRHEVLCARYAALSGLVLGPTGDPPSLAALVGPEVSELSVRLLLGPGGVCTMLSTARCGRATRTVERTLAASVACSAS